MPTTEIIALLCIVGFITALRLWIRFQPDIAWARRRVRTICLWAVSMIGLLLSAAALLFPALVPTSPVGFFLAFGAIYLLSAQPRTANPPQDTEVV